MQPDFSVVVPLYNKSAYIERAVRSALEQVDVSLEVIIVDDGSTDDGAAVVRAVDDPRIHLIQQENQGVSSARNRGCRRAAAAHIAFLDADDCWHKQHLSNIKRLVEASPDCGVFGAGYRQYASESEIERELQRSPELDQATIETIDLQAFSRRLCGGQAAFWTSALAVKKTAFAEVGGFNSDFSHGEDVAVWLAITARHGGVVSSAVTACYYRGDTTSLTRKLVDADATMELIKTMLQDPHWRPEERSALAAVSDSFALTHASSALRTHDNRSVCAHFLKRVYKRNKRWFLLKCASTLPDLVRHSLLRLR